MKKIVMTPRHGRNLTDNPSNTTKLIKIREVGDMWGTGLFKANACDFCDDVTTELADISLVVAWLPPYNQDGKGHNVVVSRSLIAEKILQAGQENGELELEKLSQKCFLASQQGSFNHRHDGMGTRIDMVKRVNAVIPPKRVGNKKNPLNLKVVQRSRRLARAQSLEVLAEYRNASELDRHMKPELLKLRFATKLSHAIGKAKRLSGVKS